MLYIVWYHFESGLRLKLFIKWKHQNELNFFFRKSLWLIISIWTFYCKLNCNIFEWLKYSSQFIKVIYCYRKFPNEVENLRPIFIKSHIIQSLHRFFGEIGGNFGFDILKFEVETCRCILRVRKNLYIELRTALATISSFQGINCCFHVISVTNILLGLINWFQICHTVKFLEKIKWFSLPKRIMKKLAPLSYPKLNVRLD